MTIKDATGEPTREFKLWLDKLAIRTPEEIAEGFRLLESKVQKDYEAGKESWPPSYAEFLALCKPYQYRQKDMLKLEHEITDEQREKNIQKFNDEIKGLFK